VNLKPHMNRSLRRFRSKVLRSTLFSAQSLDDATERLGFIQADPIRSPARAQDLILRQRLRHYQAGDLEDAYPKLPLEECYLFAYGFARKNLWHLMHPKPQPAFPAAYQEALRLVSANGPMGPGELAAQMGLTSTSQNGWGGTSRTSKLVLDSLHDRGLLRVAKRKKGIRLYEAADPQQQAQRSQAERYQELVLAGLQAMGPTTRQFLQKELGYHGYLAGPGKRPAQHKLIQELIDDGRMLVDQVDGVEYLSLPGAASGRPSPDRVRILAPFDPAIRDRARFEQLWGWAYRFEAYVPQAKRKLGYYAMPMLWQETMVGWANASVHNGRLLVEVGYPEAKPDSKAFITAAEAEVEALTTFLGLESGRWQVRW
jgi:uncharacterized protein YcaQ